MKATGIVRRIDDLGRIVVPKEIRRGLRIREGSPLEIYTGHQGEIILKKYSVTGEISEFATQYADSLAKTLGHIVCITDNEEIIAVSGGGRKELINKPLPAEMSNVIENRVPHIASKGDRNFIRLLPDDEELKQQVIVPIIAEASAIGSVIITTKDERTKLGDVEKKIAQSAADFLGRQLEI